MTTRFLLLTIGLSCVAPCVERAIAKTGDDRPNILWIVSEDNSPLLGCYGDSLAVTPIMIF